MMKLTGKERIYIRVAIYLRALFPLLLWAPRSGVLGGVAVLEWESPVVDSGSVLDSNPTKAFQLPAGPKIALCFLHLFICASTLIMCAIIMSCTWLPCDFWPT